MGLEVSHAKSSVRVTTNFVLIGYRHCSKLGRLFLNSCIPMCIHTGIRVANWYSRTAVKFSSCNENGA